MGGYGRGAGGECAGGVPENWSTVLTSGGLRGALAMVLMLSEGRLLCKMHDTWAVPVQVAMTSHPSALTGHDLKTR